MTKTDRTKIAVRLLVIFVAAILVCLLVVPFLGYGWHLLHGNFILFAGWRIPVPNGYYVIEERKGPAMFRLSLGAPIFEVPFAHLSFYNFPSRGVFLAENDYPLFEKTMVEEAIKSGYELQSRQTVSVGDKSAYCMDFTRSTKQPRSIARCAVENSKIFVFYEGDPRYLPDLRTTLQGIYPAGGTALTP